MRKKGKKRHNPDKIQNQYGSVCPYYDDSTFEGKINFHCERGEDTTDLCKGNRHNCIKNVYKKEAIKKT